MPEDWPDGFTAPSGPGEHAIVLTHAPRSTVRAACRCGLDLGVHRTVDGTSAIQRAWRRHATDVVLGEAS